jgi:hypothetical protein
MSAPFHSADGLTYTRTMIAYTVWMPFAYRDALGYWIITYQPRTFYA